MLLWYFTCCSLISIVVHTLRNNHTHTMRATCCPTPTGAEPGGQRGGGEQRRCCAAPLDGACVCQAQVFRACAAVRTPLTFSLLDELKFHVWAWLLHVELWPRQVVAVGCSAMLRACPALAFLRSAPLMGYGGNVAAASLCVKVRWGSEGLAPQPAGCAGSCAASGCSAFPIPRRE